MMSQRSICNGTVAAYAIVGLLVIGGVVVQLGSPAAPIAKTTPSALQSDSQLSPALASSPLGEAAEQTARATSVSTHLAGVETTIPVGKYPAGVSYNPVNGKIYVTNFGSSNISVIDPLSKKVVAWIPMPFGIDNMVCPTDNGNVYAGDAVNEVVVVNGSSNKILTKVPLGPPDYLTNPYTYDPSTNAVYVVSISTNNVTTLSSATNTIMKTIAVGSAPNAAVYDSHNGNVYVVNEGSRSVTIIDGLSQTVIGSAGPVTPGVAMAFVPTNHMVYVAGNNRSGGNVVSFVNDSSNMIEGVIPVGLDSAGMAYVDTIGDLFVTNRGSSTVTVINVTKNVVVDTIPVQAGPMGIAWDGETGELYIANSGTNNVTVLSPVLPSYKVSFVESGLPSGENWSVSLSGETHSATNPEIDFFEPNGTYTFLVNSPSEWTATPPSGNLVVSGANLSQAITFPPNHGAIVGTISPSTAVLRIDGAIQPVDSQGGFDGENLTVGIHAIAVQAFGYYPYSTNVSVGPGIATSLNVTLIPLPIWNSLSPLAVGLLFILAAATIASVVTAVHFARRARRAAQKP